VGASQANLSSAGTRNQHPSAREEACAENASSRQPANRGNGSPPSSYSRTSSFERWGAGNLRGEAPLPKTLDVLW
jgi:hypothetical protein